MDTAMHFERTMSLLFGEKAYQIASVEANPKHRREWLQRAIRKLLREVNTLNTTLHHRKVLMMELDAISELLKSAKDPSWGLIFCFLRLSSCLLGFGCPRGAKCHTPTYFQTERQYYTAHILRGGDVMQDYHDRKDAVSLRRSVIEDLKNQGFDDFKISLVINTSEYDVKLLRSNLPLRQKRLKKSQSQA